MQEKECFQASKNHWIKGYKTFGKDYFNNIKNKKYSADFKIKVINDYLEGKNDLSNLSEIYHIKNLNTIKNWLKIYEENGKQYFYDIEKYRSIKRMNLVKKRIGIEKQMNNGLSCQIIKYENIYNIDVKFEDGTIITNQSFKKFKDGTIEHPNYKHYVGISKNEFFIQTIFSSYGFKKLDITTSKKIGFGKLELDLYNPNFNGYKIGIEYDGFYIKSKNIGHTIAHDKRKDNICKNNNIILIRIREPQMPILKSSSICFICESSDIFSDELLKTINKIIKYLNKNFNGNIQYINYINKEKINELFYSQYTNQFKNRENEERIMQNGMKAQIKTYKNNKDVDIIFEDGYEVKGKRYIDFKNGLIKHDKYNSQTERHKQNRLHEKRTMNCGMECEITEYINAQNISVQFADGYEVKNKTYSSFKDGRIFNKNLSQTKIDKQNRENLEKIMKCGLKCKIVTYKNYRDITVVFENGVMVEHRNFAEFKRGTIVPDKTYIKRNKQQYFSIKQHKNINSKNNENLRQERLHEKRIMKCGMECEIIEYINAKNISVQFTDGYEVKNRTYSDFKNGKIVNKNLPKIVKHKNERIGLKSIMNCGLECKIIEYESATNITVEFLNDKTIIKNRKFADFQLGKIKHPNFN